jgi:hypothetical protein
MGLLDEPALERLVDAACGSCGSRKRRFRSYLDAALPLMGGEPVGRLAWVYDGEKFVDGVFEVACAACGAVVFTEGACPRCHAAGGLARALAAPNGWPVPERCPGCDDDQVRYVAFVPASVMYEGKRAERAQTAVELHDPGFHGFRVDCRDCGTVAERADTCPLCDGPGPLRARPG